MKGPSVGFHLNRRAEHSSLAYTDYLNFSWVSIKSFLSTSPNTGGLRNSLVCWISLCKLWPAFFLSRLGSFYSFLSSTASYLQTVSPTFHPLYFLLPAFLKITLACVGCFIETKYWGFLHQLGLSFKSPFFFPFPSSFISILREPPADDSVHPP